jgi:fluoroquinolone resistance protein
MEQHYEVTFEGIGHDLPPLEMGEYDTCLFRNCDFSNENLSECKFVDCQFVDCNLSMATVAKASFRDVVFKNCKMLGLKLDTCHAFGLAFSFEGCQLNHATFVGLRIIMTEFRNCQLVETDFTECDLSSAVFANCNLDGAIFDQTNVEKADFRSSFNYAIDPDLNRIKKAKFSLEGVSGLLSKYDIVIEK